MTSANMLPINFSLADAARDRIHWMMRNLAHEKFGLPALPSIFWAVDVHDDGRRSEGPAIGFYDAADAIRMRNFVQNVNSLDVVYFVTEKTWRNFNNRTLDFSNDRGFFLRS